MVDQRPILSVRIAAVPQCRALLVHAVLLIAWQWQRPVVLPRIALVELAVGILVSLS
ncbi:MAG: hypothetical protein R3F24_12700 [Gammaproteobacteria bacterium]